MKTKIPFAGRTLFLTCVAVTISSLVATKLVQLQITPPALASKKAADELIDRERIPAQRGIIMDRNEELLTNNIQSAELVADRYHLREITAVVEGLAYNQAIHDPRWDTLTDDKERRRLVYNYRAKLLSNAKADMTEEEKADYTLVLKGHLQLQNAHFPAGTCGTQLDALARIAMWKCGINYLHGTGHGIGHFLCVHEGPHQVRMNHVPTLLEPGMILTDEPGIYKAGRHGIRIENTLLIAPSQETEFGKFYRFEPLTLCPIDKKAIVTEMLSEEELTWLNDYHQMVYKRLSPLLDESEQTWLKEATNPIKR